MVFMIEAQINYMLDALETMERRGATQVEVRRDAYDAYNAHLQDRLNGHRLEHRRVLELVPRRQRPQRHDLADVHVPLLAADAPVRRAGLCDDETGPDGAPDPCAKRPQARGSLASVRDR